MTQKDRNFTLISFLSFILGITLTSICYNYYDNKHISQFEEKTVFQTDTIVRIDTIQYTNVIPVKETIYRTDTIYKTIQLKDSSIVEIPFEIPIEKKEYTDSLNYHLEIEGYRTNLNYITLFQREKEINNTTTIQYSKKQHFNYGLQLGIGYGIFTKKPDVYLGIGIQYNF